MREGFQGVYVALLTPYTKEGEINCLELKKLVRYLIGKGADGFYVGGSTGEAFLLTPEERKQILETVLDANNGEKKVIAHVGQISTAQACDLARHAACAGADAMSAVAPFYYSFSQDEVRDYYVDIMDAASLPMFVYNFPNASGFTLTPSLLDKLCNLGDVAGVKFTHNNFFQMEIMRRSHPELTIWSGIDQMLASGLIAGADGTIGSSYNIICPIARTVLESVQAGDIARAREYQTKINRVISLSTSNGTRHITGVKAVLELEGFRMGPSRRPFSPLPESARADIQLLYDEFVKTC